jgi:adenosine deaminase
MTSPDRFETLPKVELHLHLEGAIPLATLWQLIDAYGGDATAPDGTALLRKLEYSSFPEFIDTWWWMTGFLRRPDDFTLVAEAVAADLARQNIVYAEASFSPTDFERHGPSPQEIAVAIRAGLDRVAATQVVLNCDLVRDTGVERTSRTLAAITEVAETADIRGVTIGGSERKFPAELFRDVYQQARSAGFRLTAHAGEAAGPESVAAAIDVLGVERIGHGVRVVEDATLLQRVVTEQIPLEVCPTSNIRTGVVASWGMHPVGALLAAGANVTISSDDPTFFHTNVAAELREVNSRFGSDPVELTKRAVAASWMNPEEKVGVLAQVSGWESFQDS